jgi:hypothetical protein
MAKDERQSTKYVVLKAVTLPDELLDSLGGGLPSTAWVKYTTVEASNQDAAVSKATGHLDAEARSGDWRAVSESSWLGYTTLAAQQVIDVTRTKHED